MPFAEPMIAAVSGATVLLVAVAAMLGLGLLFGLGLALASRAFAVEEDPRMEQILDALPGSNCGACGYGGCRAYAEAVVEGEKVGLCTVGGADVAELIGDIMGVEVEGKRHRKRAVVHCKGGLSNCEMRAEYHGEQDCRAAHLTSGGPKACLYGCLGFGTCAEACPFDAITMSEERLPVVDADRCTACGACVRACPRDLISLLDSRYKIYLGCSSRDSGKSVRQVCRVGCIWCRRCVKEDPHDAVKMEGNLPVLDYKKAEGDFRVAAEVCPMDSYVMEEEPAPAVRAEQVGDRGEPAA